MTQQDKPLGREWMRQYQELCRQNREYEQETRKAT
jgi:hypothetical protein